MRTDTRVLAGIGVLLALAAGVLIATASPPMPCPPPPPPAPPAPPLPPPPSPPPAKTLYVLVTPSNYTNVFAVVKAPPGPPPGTTVYVLKHEYWNSVIVFVPGTYAFPPAGGGRSYLVVVGYHVILAGMGMRVKPTIIAQNVVFVDVKAAVYGVKLVTDELAVYAHPHKAASLLMAYSSLAPAASGLKLETYSEDAALTNLTLTSTTAYSPAEAVIVAKTPPAKAYVKIGPYANVEGGLKAYGYGPGYTGLTVVKALVKGVVSANYLSSVELVSAITAGLETHSVLNVSVTGSMLNYSYHPPVKTPHTIA